MRGKTRSTLPIIIAAVVLVLVLAVVIFIFATNILVSGHLYPRKAEILNLRGKEVTVEEYEKISSKLPDCDIYWDVPLSDGAFAENSQVLHITKLTDRDVKNIGYFEELMLVEAEGCHDYAMLEQLAERYPNVYVRYNVTINGTDYAHDTTEVAVTALSDADIENIRYLPDLVSVQAGQCSDYGQVEKLKSAYPDLVVATTVTIAGKEFDGETTDVTVTGMTEEDAVYLSYLPKLKSVHVTDPAMEVDKLLAVKDSLANVQFTWDVTVAGNTYAGNLKEVEITGASVDVQQLKTALSYLPDLEQVFLNDCSVDNEAMAALREEMRSQYKVVWTVQCGDITVRTDATYFMPIKEKVWYFFDEDAANLVYCEDMICVDLGHMSIHHVQWLKGMPKLKYLILAHTQVTDLTGIENCKELVFLELDWSIVRDYSPLVHCTALEDLNIGKNYADVEPLLGMTWLKHIWAVERGQDALHALLTAFEGTDTVIFYGGEETATVGGIWRQLPNYYAMRDVLGMPYMA